MTTKQTRKSKQETAQNGHSAAPQRVGMSVSQETLDLLVEGRNALLQQRQRLAQELQQVDVKIQQQEGGIYLMEQLLVNQDAPLEIAGDLVSENGHR